MTEQTAEKIIDFILALRENGITDHDAIVSELIKKFHFTEDEFIDILEMMSIGAFRATIMSSGETYPKSNIQINDNFILKITFKKVWIELKGEEHFQKYYLSKNKKWWQSFK